MSRDDLEREANRTRARLLDTLEALDQRRHDVTDDPRAFLVERLGDHSKVTAGATSALVFGAAGALGWSVYRLATRDRRRRQERWNALRRFWAHPELVARRSPPQGTLAEQLGRKLLTSAIGWIGVELARRSLSSVMSWARPMPRGLPRVVVRTLPA